MTVDYFYVNKKDQVLFNITEQHYKDNGLLVYIESNYASNKLIGVSCTVFLILISDDPVVSKSNKQNVFNKTVF